MNFLLAAFLFLIPLPGHADAAITTSFIEAHVTDVPLGKIYSYEGTERHPLVFNNPGTEPIHVQTTVVFQHQDWIRIIPQEFVIPPHGQQHMKIRFKLPKDPGLRGRRFQAQVAFQASRRREGTNRSIQIQMGIESRIILDTAP